MHADLYRKYKQPKPQPTHKKQEHAHIQYQFLSDQNNHIQDNYFHDPPTHISPRHKPIPHSHTHDQNQRPNKILNQRNNHKPIDDHNNRKSRIAQLKQKILFSQKTQRKKFISVNSSPNKEVVDLREQLQKKQRELRKGILVQLVVLQLRRKEQQNQKLVGLVQQLKRLFGRIMREQSL